MPPPGYEPFLRVICANPADDAPRLIYADWLEENGAEERAGFIRAQIELNNTQTPSREAILKGIAKSMWYDEVPKFSGVMWQQFWRGFVNSVVFRDGETFLKYAEKVFESTPINSVVLRGLRPRHVPQMANLGFLQRVTVLSLRDTPHLLSDTEWALLASGSNLGNLEVLHLATPPNSEHEPLGRHAASTLVNGAAFAKLERLWVQGPLTSTTSAILHQRFGKAFKRT